MSVQAVGKRISFRFGLSGRRWGEVGPAVLLVLGAESASTRVMQLVEPITASGRQVIALDDPTEASASRDARVAELSAAIAEAAVEIRELEAVIGDDLGADAAALALDQGLLAVRTVLREPARLAA